MILTLTPEQERKLKAKSERAQKPIEAVLDDLLSDNIEIQNGATYPIFSPHDSLGAAHIKQEALADKSSKEPEPLLSAKNLAFLALLQEWREENEALSPEEAEKGEADWEELKANLNENRRRSGEEPLFP